MKLGHQETGHQETWSPRNWSPKTGHQEISHQETGGKWQIVGFILMHLPGHNFFPFVAEGVKWRIQYTV